MDYKTHLVAVTSVIAGWMGMAGFEALAEETRAKFGFEEQQVEFHNREVKLAGSLLAPKSDEPVPAVVFVHGAEKAGREREKFSFPLKFSA